MGEQDQREPGEHLGEEQRVQSLLGHHHSAECALAPKSRKNTFLNVKQTRLLAGVGVKTPDLFSISAKSRWIVS